MVKINEPAIKKFLEKRGIQRDEVDCYSLWDDTLTQSENFDLLREHLAKIGASVNDEHTEEEYRGKNRVFTEQEIRRAKEKRKKAQEHRSISDYYCSLKRCVQAVARTSEDGVNGLIVQSEAGLGKSHQTQLALQELGGEEQEDYVYVSTYSTPLQFYRLLHKNRDNVIILDDCEGILNNPKTTSMLKSALWSSIRDREIQYHSSRLPSDLPESFCFKGKIILLVNDLGFKGVEKEAMVNRCLYHEVVFTFEEKIGILRELSKKPLGKGLNDVQRKEVFVFLKGILCESHDFNLRTYLKALDVYSVMEEGWKEVVREQVAYEKNDVFSVFLEVANGGYGSVKREIKEFRERTGRKRRTYFNYKAMARDRGLI